METHVKLLGWFYIGLGILGLFFALLLFTILFGAGLISGEGEAMAVTAIVGTVLGGCLSLVSIPGVICGIGLLQRKAWARVLVLVLGCINLVNFPLGTALGIYTLWVLINPDTEPIFTGR